MEAKNDGSYRASVTLSPKKGQAFSWGVKDSDGTWMLFEQEAPIFYPYHSKREIFRLGHRHWLGLNRQGADGYTARLWAPHAQSVELLVELPDKTEAVTMLAHGEYWESEGHEGWQRWLGRPYGYRITTSSGQKVLRADPYARVRQGPQRGVSDLFLSAKGEYRHRYNMEPDGHHLLRFEVAPAGKLRHPPALSLWYQGTRVRVKTLRALSPVRPPLPKAEHWWADHLRPDGTILLPRHHKARAYSVCVGPEPALRGFEYRLEDEHGDTYHDPWSNLLDGHHNWPRLGVVTECGRASRASRADHKPQDLRMYEIHVGSLLGTAENLRTSNFGEVAEHLPAIKRMGFNTVCLMPTNASEGLRDWGYLGTCSMAHQESYSNPGQNAEESLLDFVNRAHRQRMRVFNDVVYNHIGGFHNDLWEFDGLENCWFERDPNPEPAAFEQPLKPYDTVQCISHTVAPNVRKTPWGPIPAFTRRAVAQFFIDHAIDQIDRLGFDGLRFDFTNLIHKPGAGDHDGWKMLQGIHLRLRYFFPNAYTFAEEFPPHPIVTTPADQGGAGFNGMWNTEHQHRLIFDHHRPSITQNLVEDCLPHLRFLLDHILFPEGFAGGGTSATVLSNHDEVGNAQRLYQLVRKHPRGLDIARLVSWFSLLCPGHPIIFQGTEDLASNYFSWGLPHTWDVSSHLHQSGLPRYRLQHQTAIRDILLLRRDHPDLWAGSMVEEHHLHEARDLLMMRRGRFWIAGNFGQTARDLLVRLPREATLVANSEKKSYGYLGKQTRGLRVGGYALKVWKV